ncbi:MAG: hypothetical protein SWY16_16095 [Cyanobacteriota bacterium]|nr:hypothetical protein [Cyanobacteriota bacterium]
MSARTVWRVSSLSIQRRTLANLSKYDLMRSEVAATTQREVVISAIESSPAVEE